MYTNGCMSFGQACNIEKEHIRMALQGKLVCDETEGGFMYRDASKAECDRYILESFDGVVFEAKESLDAGRTLERILINHGIDPKDVFQEYKQIIGEESHKYNDYVYESDADAEDEKAE